MIFAGTSSRFVAMRSTPSLRGRLTFLFHVVSLLVLGLGATGLGAETVDRDFGPELPIVRSLGLGGSMDAAVDGDTLYVIGRGNLYVADISTPAAPRIVGRLANLGNTRQIEIQEEKPAMWEWWQLSKYVPST